MKEQIYVIFGIIIVIIVSIFALTNMESVPVNYLFWTSNSPLILVILFSALMGGILTTVVGSVKVFRLKRENKQLLMINEQLQNELNNDQTMNAPPKEEGSQKLN